MTQLFHQNMHVFKGGSLARNMIFWVRLGQIQVATAAGGAYLAAGFTEVLSSGPTLRTTLPILAQSLDPGLTGFVVIWVGTTSVGVSHEYIGIATNPTNFNVTHAGQVVRTAAQTWQLHWFPIGGVVNNTISMPGGLTWQADSRGIAFVAGTRGMVATPFVLGFMHNMYSVGNRYAGFQDIGIVSRLIRNNVPGYGAAEVIIGGDFNVSPRNPGQRNALAMQARCLRGAFGQEINTTAANCYDYWVVSNTGARADANCNVYANTMVMPGGSDHCGVVINGLP